MSCIRLSVVTVALDYITHVVCCIKEANRDTAGEDHNLLRLIEDPIQLMSFHDINATALLHALW